MTETKRPDLGNDPIGGLVRKFALPAIVGLMINASYNLVDRIFIGNGVGSAGLAGIAVAFPTAVAQLAFGLMIGIGGGVNFSVALGQKKIPRAERVFANAVLLVVFVAVAFSALHMIFMRPLLRLFGATPTIMPYAETYLKITLFGSVFWMTNMTLNNFIRACGYPHIAMFTMLIGAVSNTILDPLFIFVFKAGIAGAAYATVIAQALSFVWASSFFLSGKSPYRFRRKYAVPSLKIMMLICFVGTAPFLIQLTNGMMQTIINNTLVKYGGDIAVSAMGATIAVTVLMFMPVAGLCEGSQPVVGFNLGARKYDRVLKVYRLTIVISTGLFVLGWAVLRLFSTRIIEVFNKNDPELIRIGAVALKTIGLMYPLIGLSVATTYFLQSVKRPHAASVLALSRQLLFVIPGLYFIPKRYGLIGVFYAFPIADLLGFLVAVPVAFRLFEKYGALAKEQPTAE